MSGRPLVGLAFALLFAAAVAVGLVAAYANEEPLTWVDIDAHYRAGADLSDAPYDDALCEAMAQMLALNPNAYFVWDDPTTRRSRDREALQPEYARHCRASAGAAE